MLKKILLGVLFIALIAVLVVGAVNRTIGRTENTVEASGRNVALTQTASGIQGGKRNGGNTTANSAALLAEQVEILTLSGTVAQVPAPGIDLILATEEGDVVIGTGPTALSEYGLDLAVGDEIEVSGYWEDELFKVTQIFDLESGLTVVFRDEIGRPTWSGGYGNGGGNNGPGVNTASSSAGAQSAATAGQYRGGQGTAGRGQDQAVSSSAGTGQAQPGDWITLAGTVSTIDTAQCVVTLDNGEAFVIEGRSWSFAQEQGFWADPGDNLLLTGFYDGDMFEIGQIENVSDGSEVLLRSETGRPLWAGGGRRVGSQAASS